MTLAACARTPERAQASYCAEILRSNDCTRELVCSAPLAALLAVPACFDGKDIKVSGYVAHDAGSVRLYMSKDSASNYFLDESVRLELVPGSLGESVFIGKDRYLTVFGEFRVGDPRGIGSMLVSRRGAVATEAQR